jgi:hypothetical protein
MELVGVYFSYYKGERYCVHEMVMYVPPIFLTIESKMIMSKKSNLLETHVPMVSILRATRNHIPSNIGNLVREFIQ